MYILGKDYGYDHERLKLLTLNMSSQMSFSFVLDNLLCRINRNVFDKENVPTALKSENRHSLENQCNHHYHKIIFNSNLSESILDLQATK